MAVKIRNKKDFNVELESIYSEEDEDRLQEAYEMVFAKVDRMIELEKKNEYCKITESNIQ